jgi:hypothetical protein
LKDQKFLNWIKPEIWTDMGGKWHAVEMPEIVQINDNTFRFTGSLRPENNRYFSYKVRFKLGNNFYVYLPKEPGNNGHIIAIEPEDIDSIVLRLRSKGVDSKFVNGVISDHSFAWKWRPGGESGEEHLLFDKGERDLLTFLDVAEKVGLEENGFYSLCFHCSREGYKGDVLTHLSRVFLEGKPALSVLKEKVAVYERLIESIPGQNAAAILTRIEITQKAIAFVKNAIRAAIDPSFKPKLRIPESEPLPAVEDKHKRLLYEVDAAA